MRLSKKNSNKKKILELLLQVENNARHFKIFRPQVKCLIGFSGGQDSISSVLFLRMFQRKWNLQYDLVYCHHGWQQDSFYNVLQIIKYATLMETGYFVFFNPKQAKSQSLNKKTSHQEKRQILFSEAQGRDWRFRCIARLYSAEKYEIVLTGHTATDRSETAFLQLIRGTSFYGMTSLGRNKTFKSIYPKYFNYSVFL